MVKDKALVATRLRAKNVVMRGAFSGNRFPSVEIHNVMGISEGSKVVLVQEGLKLMKRNS